MSSSHRRDIKEKDVLAALLQLGIAGTSPHLDGEFRGGQCHIFKVSFHDKSSLAIRVPLYMSSDDRSEVEIEALRSELRTLRALEAKGFPWSPKRYGECLTFDNTIGHPFLVLGWIDGTALSWSEDFPPRPARDKVLGQMAAIQLALIECTLEDGSSAINFFERLARNRRTRVEKGQIAGLSVQDCHDQRVLLDAVLGSDGSDTKSAMDHGDIQPQNIIVDPEYNIRGVIDWAFADMTPIPRAAGLPRFLWPSVVSPPSPATIRDRESYIASVSAQKLRAASYMCRWQTAPDVDFCTLYLESLYSKGMHLSLAQAAWRLPGRESVKGTLQGLSVAALGL